MDPRTPSAAQPVALVRPATSARVLRAYQLLLGAAATVAFPAALLGLALRPAWREGARERLGRVPASPPDRPTIWLHGASVGEVAALGPLARALRHERPDHHLVLSSMTVTGRAAAVRSVPDADGRILFPLDVGPCVARALDAVRPRLVLFSETELWPSFLAALARRGIPAIMVSGRLSARAFARYRRWRPLFAPGLASVRWLCVQSQETAQRLLALGARPERIVVTGSLKSAVPAGAGVTLAALGVDDRPVLVAGSTHPGEETAVLDAWARIVARVPAARLVLAPRRPERFAEVAALLAARGVGFARRSALGADRPRWPVEAPVLLLDTLGELAGLYAGARVAFVGGTLAPVGGHNVLEPARYGTPVVFGPHVESTRDAATRLLASGAGIQVGDAERLAERLMALMADADLAAACGRRGAALARGDAGPLVVTLAVVRGTLAALDDAARGGRSR